VSTPGEPVELSKALRDFRRKWRLKFETPVWLRLVVCHGDACAPATLIDDDGHFLAIVDLGRLGIGDRWADLAVATYSLGWNYVGNWEAELLDAYGIDRDEERIDYYRRLWDAT